MGERFERFRWGVFAASLAALGIGAVQLWPSTPKPARDSEIGTLGAELKLRQEQHHVNHGEYLALSRDETDLWPHHEGEPLPEA